MTTNGRTGARDTIRTGFPSLDVILGGGIRRGDLVALGGDVGSGKSAMALSMAMRAARGGGRASFYSSEMRPERVRERMIAMERRITLDELRMARGGVEADDSTLPLLIDGMEGAEREDEPTIKLLTPGTAVETLAEEIASDFDLDLAVVDNLQALATDRRPLDEELAAGVRKLKSAAIDSGTAILLLTHCAVDRSASPVARPTLSDFGALGAVKQHADVVLGIFREEMYESARGIDGAAELLILKNRHGVTGYVDLFFYKKWLRFEDMVEE